MSTKNGCRLAVRAVVGVLALGCVTAFAAGVVTARASLVDGNGSTVGSVSAKDSNLGNFVTDTTLKSRATAGDTFQVWVTSPTGAFAPFRAGTFTTSAGGKGGVLYVNNFTVSGDFVVSVYDMADPSVAYAQTGVMSLP